MMFMSANFLAAVGSTSVHGIYMVNVFSILGFTYIYLHIYIYIRDAKVLRGEDSIRREVETFLTAVLGGQLQAMMKDQFANYVVQKVLETCDEAQRELLLGRIRVHLHALKKYTYGKHIVARVEKLVAAGGNIMA